MCIFSGTWLFWHTKEPGKCVGLYRMLYSGFILVNRNTLGPSIFPGCHRMLQNSGVGLHKFHCIYIFTHIHNCYNGQEISCILSKFYNNHQIVSMTIVCLRPFSTLFQLYWCSILFMEKKQKKTPTCHKLLTNIIT